MIPLSDQAEESLLSIEMKFQQGVLSSSLMMNWTH